MWVCLILGNNSLWTHSVFVPLHLCYLDRLQKARAYLNTPWVVEVVNCGFNWTKRLIDHSSCQMSVKYGLSPTQSIGTMVPIFCYGRCTCALFCDIMICTLSWYTQELDWRNKRNLWEIFRSYHNVDIFTLGSKATNFKFLEISQITSKVLAGVAWAMYKAFE
jgi:hypothetical protein